MSVHKARMKIKYNRPAGSSWWSLRWGAVMLLFAVLAVGGFRYFVISQRAGALDFTTHLLSADTTAPGVLGIEAADIDDDGDVDVITCGKDGLKVYQQITAGSFEAKLIDDKDCERVVISDLDKDGASDLLITMIDMQPSVRWYRNTGNVEFSGTAIGTGSKGKAFVGDIDANGAPDIITATTQSELVVLERWMNNGSGVFTSTQLSADSGVEAIGVGDISGNGYPDIVTGGSKGVQRWGTSDGLTFSRIDIDDTHFNQKHLVVADVNKDNKLDVVAAETEGNQVIYYRNLDQRAFQRIDIGSDVDATTVAVVDLDEDGDEDVMVAAQDDNLIAWLDNDGSDSFTKKTIADGLQSIFGVRVVDLDNDNDFDVVGGNHMRGTVYWYERVVAKPVASEPTSITQSTDGKGVVTFDTTLSDADFDATRIRVQYSLDGVNWYKPWLTEATPSAGSVSLKNSDGYQVGTTNAIDTNSNSTVTVTMKWDSRSAENTGGPVSGEQKQVRLRIIPRDKVGNGETATSDTFELDNLGPVIGSLKIAKMESDTASLSWGKASDNSGVAYRINYGTNAAQVLSGAAELWDSSKDAELSDINTVNTDITGLEEGKFYTFKLSAVDDYGNETSVPSVSGQTVKAGSGTTEQPSVVPTVTPVVTTTVEPTTTPATTVLPSNEPTVSATPTTTRPPRGGEATNLPPRSDAGADLVVNTGALVILDGTSSLDPEGASLTYNWRQVVGKPVDLSAGNTATPSFTAAHEDESYVFALTVRDIGGLVATDSVTVVTRPSLEQVVQQKNITVTKETKEVPFIVSSLLAPANLVLLVLSFLITGVAIQSKIPSFFKQPLKLMKRQKRKERVMAGGHVLRMLDAKTGRRLAGIKLVIKGMDDRVWSKAETSETGEARVQLPVGKYVIELKGGLYSFAPAGLSVPVKPGELVYTGGILQVKRQNEPMVVLSPLKQAGSEVKSWRMRMLKGLQFVQRRSHLLAWPVYLAGAGLNTALLLWVPQLQYLMIEVIYVGIVLVKVWMEVRQIPSYGVVRDAISRVPLDLAVVRLYEEKTNRLVLTRATNGQGKFFALPPSGVYTVTVTKPGYATFTKHAVAVGREQSKSMQIQTELMPIVPKMQSLGAMA